MKETGRTHLHVQLAEALKREILSGVFDESGRLPSESELSRRFGVSRTTMSRVMLDLRMTGLIVTHPGAPAELSRFARNATGVLGIMDPGESRGAVLSAICRCIQRLAERSGWEVLLARLSSENPRDRLREARRIARDFSVRHVSGIFMQPLEFQQDNESANGEIVATFDRYGLSVVLLDYDIVAPPARSRYDVIGIDNVTAGHMVGRSLLQEEGCRHVAFLLPPGSPPTVAGRMNGVAAAVVEAGGSWSMRRNVLQARPADMQSVRRFLSGRAVDAIVCGNDAVALELRRTLAAVGRTDVRLGGFDGTPAAAAVGVVSAAQPVNGLAVAAMQMLLSRIKNPRLPARSVSLPAVFRR